MPSYLSGSAPSRTTGSYGAMKTMAGLVFGRLQRILPDEWNRLVDDVINIWKTVGAAGSTDANSHEHRLDDAASAIGTLQTDLNAVEAEVADIYDACYTAGEITPAMGTAAKTATTDTSNWGWGAYSEIWAAGAVTDKSHVYALFVEGIQLKGTVDGFYELELAEGAIGSESPIGRVPFQATKDADVIPVVVPIQTSQLAASTRLSFRVRYDDGGTADSDVDVRVLFHRVGASS